MSTLLFQYFLTDCEGFVRIYFSHSYLCNVLDTVKRKAIPQWIREALEKREKDKQKEFAKQHEEENAPEVEQDDVKVDEIKDEVKEEVEEKKPFFKIKKVRNI